MTKEAEYKVYVFDADGSERIGTTVIAKSTGHAYSLARKQGITKISDVEKIQ